jgi:hypothetical protein
MKVTNMKKYLGFIVAAMMLAPTASMATVYECNTKQVMWWHQGKIEPYKGANAREHEILRFNDETGDMEQKYDQNSVSTSSHLEIVKKMDSSGELVALSTGITTVNNNSIYVGADVFRLRANKGNEIIYLYSNYFGANRISSGICHISSAPPY